MPYMIRMSVEQLSCVILFLYIVYLHFETSQSWRSLLRNVEQRTNDTKQSIRHSKNWKGTTQKDDASLFVVHKNTLSTRKMNKGNIFEKHNSGLISKRVKPERYKELKKALHKWFLILRSENVPIRGPLLK